MVVNLMTIVFNMFNDFKIVNSFTLENSFFARYTEEERERINNARNKRIQKESECSSKSRSHMRYDSDTSAKGAQTRTPIANPPHHIYDNVMGCHHFTSEDHLRLGEDLCHIFHKVFISQSVGDQEQAKKVLKTHLA